MNLNSISEIKLLISKIIKQEVKNNTDLSCVTTDLTSELLLFPPGTKIKKRPRPRRILACQYLKQNKIINPILGEDEIQYHIASFIIQSILNRNKSIFYSFTNFRPIRTASHLDDFIRSIIGAKKQLEMNGAKPPYWLVLAPEMLRILIQASDSSNSSSGPYFPFDGIKPIVINFSKNYSTLLANSAIGLRWDLKRPANNSDLKWNISAKFLPRNPLFASEPVLQISTFYSLCLLNRKHGITFFSNRQSPLWRNSCGADRLSIQKPVF